METMTLEEYQESIGRRKSAGANARVMGESFQLQVNAWCSDLRMRGLAVIHMTGPLTRVTGKDKNGPVLRFAGKGPCDFIGVAGQRFVAFEAKSTEKSRYNVREDEAHQYSFMLDCLMVQPSAIVGYLIEYRSDNLVCWHELAGTSYSVNSPTMYVDCLENIFRKMI